jgi:hypothetical protein
MDARSRAPQRYVVPLSEIPWVCDGSLPRVVETTYTVPSDAPMAPPRAMPLPRPPPPESSSGTAPERLPRADRAPPSRPEAPPQGLFDLPGLLGRIWMVSEIQHARESPPEPSSTVARVDASMRTVTEPVVPPTLASSEDVQSVHRTTRWISLTIVENQTDSPVPTRVRSPLPVPRPDSGAPGVGRSGASGADARAWTCPGCRITNGPGSVVCAVCHRAPPTGMPDGGGRTRRLADPSESW